MLIPLIEIKTHLREDLDPDPLKDQEIESFYQAAVEYCELYIDREITVLSPSLRAAILLIVADLYANRESQGDSKLYGNATVHNILNLSRVELGV